MPADSRAALKHLISALALGDGFQFHIVVSQSPRQIRQLLATLAEAVPARRGGSLRSEHLAPYDILPRDAPLDGAALAALVTTHLDAFPAPTAAERLVFALDATFTGEADIPAWRLLFRRMNEQRNALARRLDAALLLCLSPRLEAAFAQEAPDFWSLRGVSITMEAETTAADASPALQAPTVERMPASMEAGDEAAGRELAGEVDRARQRTLAHPDELGTQRALLIWLNRLGDHLALRGHTNEALTAYREALAITEHLAHAEPERADYQREISVSYDKLGELMAALGQGEAARDFFQKALAIAERLARAEPERTDHQRDLSVSYNKLGDLMAALGQGEAARDFFEKDLAISERLARAEPERADYQRDLCVPYERLGDLLHKDGNIGAALDSFRQSLAIWERLADAEPERADLQRGLVVPLTRMAQLEPDKAHTYLGRALQILRTLKSAGRQFEKLDEWIAGLEKWIEQS